jgi:hypothetical protein
MVEIGLTAGEVNRRLVRRTAVARTRASGLARLSKRRSGR